MRLAAAVSLVVVVGACSSTTENKGGAGTGGSAGASGNGGASGSGGVAGSGSGGFAAVSGTGGGGESDASSGDGAVGVCGLPCSQALSQNACEADGIKCAGDAKCSCAIGCVVSCATSDAGVGCIPACSPGTLLSGLELLKLGACIKANLNGCQQ